MEFTSDSFRDAKYRSLAINLARRIVFEVIDKKFKKIEMHLHEPIAEETVVKCVHKVWNPDFVGAVGTPEFMPRMNENDVCPKGSFLLEISYVTRISGGMGSYYQFDGYFLSVVVSHDGLKMLDCRFEKAT